jgi:hypothetical protein
MTKRVPRQYQRYGFSCTHPDRRGNFHLTQSLAFAAMRA